EADEGRCVPAHTRSGGWYASNGASAAPPTGDAHRNERIGRIDLACSSGGKGDLLCGSVSSTVWLTGCETACFTDSTVSCTDCINCWRSSSLSVCFTNSSARKALCHAAS